MTLMAIFNNIHIYGSAKGYAFMDGHGWVMFSSLFNCIEYIRRIS